MLAYIGAGFAITFGLYLTWMVIRFTLELRTALVDAASGSWDTANTDTATTKAAAAYCRQEIVLRHGHAPYVITRDSTHQPPIVAPLADVQFREPLQG